MSVKLREATKELNIDNKLALFLLEEFNMPAKSLQSTLTFEQLEILRDFAENNEKFSEQIKKFQQQKKAKIEEKLPQKTEQKEEKPDEEKPQAEKKVTAEKVKETVKKKSSVQEKQEKPVDRKDKVLEKKKEQLKEPEKEKPEVKAKQKEEQPAEILPEAEKAPEKQEATLQTSENRAEKEEPPVKKQQEAPAAGEQKKRTPEVSREPQQKPVQEQKKVIVRKESVIELPTQITVSEYSSLKDLADKFQCKLKYLEDRLTCSGIECYSKTPLNKDELVKVTGICGVKAEVISFEDEIFFNEIEKKKAQLVPRAPIITVMGHVDHGKTTLLDTLRKTRVAEKEPGLITQKIGAYKLIAPEGQFIFIDTPGHEAFVNLRARGSKVTDIVVLVVAANDGVQPQTVEAINHARSANVPMIVAINKIDVSGANVDKVKKDLMKFNVVVEDWGGDVVSVEISAKFNKNLNLLLEMLNLIAQMQELKAYNQVAARGVVLETRLDPKAGIVATILLQHGEFRRGDYFICGSSIGKVRAIFSDLGKDLPLATFNDPVEITGFEQMPEPGDLFQVFNINYLEKARIVAEMRRLADRKQREESSKEDKRLTLENLFEKINRDQEAVLPLLIKADSFGSLEVLEMLLHSKSQ